MKLTRVGVGNIILAFIFLVLFLCFCTARIEDQTIKDYGKKEIAEGVFLKKITVGQDRVYILVDRDDRLVSGSVSMSFTTGGKNSRHTETNSFLTGEK